MTPQEFKAWFEGFTESMNGRPTAAQWARICKRVKGVDNTSTSYPVFIDRYMHSPLYGWNIPFFGNNSIGIGSNNVNTLSAVSSTDGLGRVNFEQQSFNPQEAFRALGKEDFGAVQ